MIKYSLLIGVALLFAANNSLAEDYSCESVSNCETLGFNKTEAECAGKKFIRCSQDLTKVYCGDFSCEELGYTADACLFSACNCNINQQCVEEACSTDSSKKKCVCKTVQQQGTGGMSPVFP